MIDKQINFLLNFSVYYITQNQLTELLTIFSRFPQSTRIEITGSEHATGAKVLSNNKYRYFDSNCEAPLDQDYESRALSNLIIRTKYERLQVPHWFVSKYQISFMAYHFPWEHIDKRFNYYTNEELPKNKEEACAMTLPENGFTPLHIAILTNSMDNLEKLVKDGYCDINEKDANKKTPIELAYELENFDACHIILKNCHETLDCNQLIQNAFSDNNFNLVDLIIARDDYLCDSDFLNILITTNSPLLEKLLNLNKINKEQTLNLIVFKLNSDETLIENTNQMELIYRYYCHTKDADGNGLLHIAAQNCKLHTLRFLLSHTGEWLNSTNAAGKTAFSLFCEQLDGHYFFALDNEIRSILNYLPKKITPEDGKCIMKTLHQVSEPLLSEFLPRVCDAIGDVSQPIGTSIFNYTLLMIFVKCNNTSIVNELIKRAPKSILFQRNDGYTTLHDALLINPETLLDKQKIANRHIIKLLIENGADVDVANMNGVTCRDLIKQHADPEIVNIMNGFIRHTL